MAQAQIAGEDIPAGAPVATGPDGKLYVDKSVPKGASRLLPGWLDRCESCRGTGFVAGGTLGVGCCPPCSGRGYHLSPDGWSALMALLPYIRAWLDREEA